MKAFIRVLLTGILACSPAPEPAPVWHPPPPPVTAMTPVPLPMATSASADAGVTPVDAGAPRGLVLSVRLVGPERVQQGDGIAVVATLENTGPGAATVQELSGGLDYDVVMVDRDGATRPPTRFGRKRISARGAAQASPHTLQVGDRIEAKMLASRLVDTSDVGRYSLTVVRRSDGDRPLMASNEVAVDVR